MLIHISKMPADVIVVPFRAETGSIAPAKHIRSTLITSSMTALRRRALMPQYESLVPSRHREELLACIPGEWLPMAIGVSHYETCNALGLSPMDTYEIGLDVSVQVQSTFLGILAKLAHSAGVTPWTGLSQFPRLWDRVLDGGGFAVYRLGPKEACIDIVALSLVDIPYFRAAFRGFIVAGCSMFSTKVYGREIPSSGKGGRVQYRMSWA